MRMRLGLTLLSVLMMASAAPRAAQAEPAPGRTENAEYVAGGLEKGPDGDQIGFKVQGMVGGVDFVAGAERTLSIAITDRSGNPVLANVGQDGKLVTTFCGATPKPVKIKPFVKVSIFLFNGKCNGKDSFVTAGNVEATFRAGK